MRMPYPSIRGNVLDSWIEEGADMVLVDLRTRQEYGAAHLRGAVNLPFQEIAGRFRELPADKTLVFYCGRGAQSMRVCGRLCRMGFRVVNLAGGLLYYRGKYLEAGGEKPAGKATEMLTGPGDRTYNDSEP